MSWAVGVNGEGRDVGYGVPAHCDHPGCTAEIERGISYTCGGEPGGGEHGCGLFVCGKHQFGNKHSYQLCRHCADRRHKRLTASADHPEWINHKLTDETWQQWRDENPEEVAKLLAATQQPKESTP